MNTRIYAFTSSLVFLLFALVHALRLYGQWNVVVGDWVIPMWASVAGVLVGGYLSFQGFLLYRGSRWVSWL